MSSRERVQTYRERRPAAPLEPWVSAIWVQWVSPEHAAYRSRTVPNGAAEVVWPLGSALRVVGPQTAPRMETLAPGSMIVGARLRIGAALGMPMSELVDRELDASELWGTRPLRLAEQCAGTPALACEMLERELLARLDAVPDPLVAETVRTLTSRGLERVGALPGRLHLSERQLNRRCLTATGLAPKLLQRMLRFQRFLALAHAGGLTRAGLARLAATAGYTDQPHLNRECARLTGVSPGTLLREAEMHCAGAHDHTPSYAPLLAQDV